MNVYETKTMQQRLEGNTYPGRGIVLGMTPDGKQSVAAYFIMGRSVNSRNRVFIQEPDGIRTEAFDPSKMEDPSLINYHPVREVGRGLIVTNGDQTDTIREFLEKGLGPQRQLPQPGVHPGAGRHPHGSLRPQQDGGPQFDHLPSRPGGWPGPDCHQR